jgi:hypothetical protein
VGSVAAALHRHAMNLAASNGRRGVPFMAGARGCYANGAAFARPAHIRRKHLRQGGR